jgi:hypothetical protein
MSLDLVVLTPEAASSYEQALSIYRSEDEEGDPSTPELKAFADEVDARFGDDDWPFTGDPLLFSDHVSLEIAHQRWGEVVPPQADCRFGRRRSFQRLLRRHR